MTRRDRASGDLFAGIPQPPPPVPASMDYRQRVSALIGDMLADARAAGLDRYEVASRASRLAGRDISKAMLDGYTAESREEFNVPLWVAPVLETVCSSRVLADWHATALGGRILFGAATLDAEIGRIEREREVATDRLRQLKELRRSAR